MAAASLRKKAVGGITWNVAERIAVSLGKFVIGVILARILTPSDFGLIGMITIFFAIAEALINGGLGQAYVQKNDVNNTDANTIFFTNLIISIIIYLVIWILAPHIADFYSQPKLVLLTRVLAIIVIINALRLIQIAQIRRSLNFKAKAKITVLAVIISGLIGIGCAYFGLGVWSLVIQQLLNRTIVTIGLFITSSWSPKLEFSISSFKELFSYGIWMMGTTTLQSFFRNIYQAVIGRFFPAAELGFFSKAKQINNLISRQFLQSVILVSFSVLAKKQQDLERIRKASNDFLKYTTFLIIPVLVTLIIISESFVIILFTEKWADMVIFLQLFCIVGIITPLYSLNQQIILALGKSKLSFKLSFVRNILIVINISIFYNKSVEYLIIGEIASVLISYIVITFYSSKLISYGLLKQLSAIRYILTSVIISGIISSLVISIIDDLWMEFIAGILINISTYLMFMFIFQRQFFLSIISLLPYKNNR